MLRIFLNKTISRSISSMLLTTFLIINFFIPLNSFGLTSGPSQPEFGQFESASASEMVNLFTGDFSYNIPLLDVEGYPVNISYKAGSNMEDEASWVGLGWNINPGAISRTLRGMPDEFNGDVVKRRIGMKDYTTYGGLAGFAFEFSGVEKDKNISFGGGINGAIALGASYNNYKGWGSEFGFDFGLSGNMSKESGPGLTAGLGLGFKASSLEGTEFAPYAGLGVSYSKASKANHSKWGASLNGNYSPSLNSRSGVWNQTWSAAVSAVYGKEGKTKTIHPHGGLENTEYNGTYTSKGGVGFNSSATVLGSSLAFSPQIPFNTHSKMWSVDIKIGGANCLSAYFGTLRGYYSSSGIAANDNDFGAFGYMHEENANTNNSLLDFSREKDGTMYKESTNLPVTSHNYDMYSVTSQGLSGGFRPHRNDIGVVFDPRTSENSSANSYGGEIGFGPGVNVGLNYVGTFAKGYSGKWNSDMQNVTNFNGSSTLIPGAYTDKEYFYHSFAGERTISDKTHKTVTGSENAVNAGLVKVSNENYKTSDSYNGGGQMLANAAAFSNSGIPSRKPRNRNITMLTADNAKNLAIEKQIRNYRMNYFKMHQGQPGNVQYFSGPGYEIDRDAILSSVAGLDSKINSHVSEITSTDIDGSRYVYGIPAYNLYQKDVVFSTEQSVDGNGYVSYTQNSENTLSGTPSNGNGNGKEGYIETTITPSYAHSYLLTSILSPDYVDLTDNGPSQDDYGTYIKYNYSRAGDMGWRVPLTDQDNKAIYNEGFYSDPKDNKGSYTYGVKQVWYLHSIETKNYVAFFQLSDRDDASGAKINNSPTLAPFTEESASKQSNSNLTNNGNPLQIVPDAGIQYNQKPKKLDKIILYNKQDLTLNNNVGTPIKTVNFEYDYTLCKGVPNQINSGQGKLTLKKIWFTFGNTPTTKGILSPFEFAYNDQVDHNFIEDGGLNNANPNYNPKDIDRWGNYKPSGNPLDNIKYPYVEQASKTAQDVSSRAWCLNTIKTPSGGLIKIDYESDDYAFIMEKRAGQMFKVLGFATTASDLSPTNSMYNNVDNQKNYLVADITNMPSGLKDGFGNDINGIPGSYNITDANNFVARNYLNGLDGKIFFKMKVQLNEQNTSNEFVPGYADILDVTPVKSTVGGNYDRLYVHLKPVTIGDKKHSTKIINPVVKAGLQMGRKFLQEIMYHNATVSAPSPLEYFMQLAGSFGEVKALVGGVNKNFIDKGYCRYITTAESFVRLINPNKRKLGGGNRVKKISVSDLWNEMISSEQSHSYTQTYNYSSTDETGRIVSTGVANYEPLLGGDENSYRYPTRTKLSSSLSLNDELTVENPIGETLLPNGYVGYSKITVNNEYDNNSGTNVKAHGTGKTQYEFYTAQDFPYKFLQTNLEKQIVHPKTILKLIKLKSKEKMYASQGYAIKLNDMHGKPKAVIHFAEGQSAPISGVRYLYKSNGNELDNNVDVIDSKNTISTEEVGVDIDLINDSRMAKNKTRTFSVSGNVATFACSFWVPLVFIWPGYSKIENHFYSLSTTKTIQKYGVLDKIIAFDNNSTVETQNTLYDKETGEVVMTKTVNQFNDPVYNFTYPAHWAYSGMGPAYKNSNLRFVHKSTSPVINSTGQITNSTVKSLLQPGDEIAIYNAVGILSNSQYINGSYIGPKYWVVKDLNNASATFNEVYLLDKDGVKANLNPASNYIFEVQRSGRRNLQNTPIGSLTSLANPRTGNNIVVNAAKKIVNTSAVEFDDKWNLYASYIDAKDPIVVCTPNTTSNFNLFQKLFNCYLATCYNLTNDLNTCRIKIYWGKNSGNLEAPLTSCTGFNMTDLNNLLSINSLPTTGLTGTTSWSQISILVTRTLSNNYEIKIERQIYNCNPGCADWAPIGVPSFGTCVINLSKVAGVPTINSHPPFPAQFSNFTTGIQSFPQNVFQVNVNANGYPYNSFSGTYQGTIPCGGDLYSGLNCVTDVCANSFPGNINPYFQSVRGNYRAKRSFNYMMDRIEGSPQIGGVMVGDIRDDGVLGNIVPFWNYLGASQTWTPLYKLPAQTTNPKGIFDDWVISAEINKIDRNGNVLQAQSTLKRPSASLYGYNFTRTTATAANSLYTDIAFDNFEDYDYVRDQCIEHFKFYQFKSSLSTVTAHTGKHSLKVNNSSLAKVKGTLNSNSSSYSESQNIVTYNPLTFVNYDLTQDVYAPTNTSGLYGIKQSDCAGRFGPLHSNILPQTYVLSVWVKLNAYDAPNLTDYGNAIGANFRIDNVIINTTAPKKSKIIDGWQKLDYTFTVATNIASNKLWQVDLYNNSDNYEAYFDDIRIHPFNSSIVTSVYDPHSLRIWAELDDRNFATLYEYDEEGALVRVKKETEKGIYTTKETRASLKRR